ncbi:MAG: hypothetical protein KDE59_09235 [Anaerolineales bacterium]|nr:hypothetical protein [Anaerolineales bacterium]MCB0007095.1 hypothetical protein [Anaerolineales bacterium]MCB0012692.1 hypothetical protein [Anaerolineales bacterium]
MTPVQHLSLSTLSQRCQAESNRFFAGEAHDTSFCFELFRRAFVDQDEGAWDLVHGQYLSLVTGWVMRHSAFHNTGEEADLFANAAFYKMWRAVDAEKFQKFNQLNEVLRYLQMCVGSVITDYLRSQDQSELVDELPRSLDIDWDTDVEGEISAAAVQRRFWSFILERLNSEEEVAVIHDLFVLALKPREILERRTRLFKDVKQIYRIRENVIDRLRRDEELADFLGIHA